MAMVDYVVDARDGAALRWALDVALPSASSLTVYMCWHGGSGHDYPAEALGAARRLRERHAGSDDQYTMLTFEPSAEELRLFAEVAPYCDLAYATDGNDDVLADVSGEGAQARVRLTSTQYAALQARYPAAAPAVPAAQAAGLRMLRSRLAARRRTRR